jgi:hypothetical protein
MPNPLRTTRSEPDSAEVVPLSAEALREHQEHLLDQIAQGAELCREIERKLAEHPAPELETIIRLHRVLVLKLSVEAEGAPAMLKLTSDLMKPLMDWARLEEKRKEVALAEQKHRDQMEAQRAEREKASGDASKALSTETLQKIERELHLF